MSIGRIQQYYSQVEKIIQHGGSRNETALRSAFQRLLEDYSSAKNLQLIAELAFATPFGTTVNPDGTLKDALRQDRGYWESKDAADALDAEIAKKLAKGYPSTNMLFEDSQTAVLYRDGVELARVAMGNPAALDALLNQFVGYEPREVQAFRAAIERFKADLPGLLIELRGLIEYQAEHNATFTAQRAAFLEICQGSINPAITLHDVREMIIQHILTEDIFTTVFNDAQFHRENTIAQQLNAVVNTFFIGAVRRTILSKIEPYSKIIRAAASTISDHHEKQRFLKVVYENFYKAYNPAAADRLGIVYTPNEIVTFMLAATDYIVEQYFGRTLADKNVEILDPATGTGTFITALIDYLPKAMLPYKYANELHCNEVAILPYYIANLNIEYTYTQKMGTYVEFSNICFVDTLDNLGFDFAGKQGTFFSIGAENLERIKRQNQRTISVIIGNPPYNANQINENENNKNRAYPAIDQRIKDTYIKQGTAQKTKLYDMYSRFIRWSSDRLGKNGVIAFVSNNSFIDASGYDGFRKVLAEEFNEIYIINLKGNARTSGERRRAEGGNVFSDEIRVGVAIYFLVRRVGAQGCRIYYTAVDDYTRSEGKKDFLRDNTLQSLPFQRIMPDKNYTWINQSEVDWDALLPVASKASKFSHNPDEERAIFKLYSLGIATNRDEWVYDLDAADLAKKIQFFFDFYAQEQQRWHTSDKKMAINDFIDRTIKWTSELESHLARGNKLQFDSKYIRRAMYRPFVQKYVYYDNIIIHRPYNQMDLFLRAEDDDNIVIAVNTNDKLFNALASKYVVDLHFNGDSQCLPLYRYTKDGTRQDNITEWALRQFQTHYDDATISRRAIFAYVYAVLHDPTYRQTYALNLKHELPRIPWYADFWRWAAWGESLLDLHINYETVVPAPLQRLDNPAPLLKPNKPILRAHPGTGTIQIDQITTLTGVPTQAWEYVLGNRTALGWVLERAKESTPSDPTIRARFNTYRFADHKERIIALLGQVCAVSVATIEIVTAMAALPASERLNGGQQ